MFDMIKDKMLAHEQHVRELESKIAEHFDDPVAQNTGWTQLAMGSGSSYRSQKLASAHNQIRVVKTARALILPVGFGLAGIALILAALNDYLQLAPTGTEPLSTSQFLSLLLIGAFLLLPAAVFLRPKNKLTFDKSSGNCWRGRKPASGSFEDSDQFRLQRIKGLQMLAKRVSGSHGDRTYSSYELNLILDNHDRINVMDHGDVDALRADAEKLSEFLDVPLFDASRLTIEHSGSRP